MQFLPPSLNQSCSKSSSSSNGTSTFWWCRRTVTTTTKITTGFLRELIGFQ